MPSLMAHALRSDQNLIYRGTHLATLYQSMLPSPINNHSLCQFFRWPPLAIIQTSGK